MISEKVFPPAACSRKKTVLTAQAVRKNTWILPPAARSRKKYVLTAAGRQKRMQEILIFIT